MIAEDFPAAETAALLRDHPDAVAWLDLFSPGLADLEAVAAEFGLHPLAVEDAVEDHQRPKIDRYADHIFVNLYAVRFHGGLSTAELLQDRDQRVRHEAGADHRAQVAR